MDVPTVVVEGAAGVVVEVTIDKPHSPCEYILEGSITTWPFPVTKYHSGGDGRAI